MVFLKAGERVTTPSDLFTFKISMFLSPLQGRCEVLIQDFTQVEMSGPKTSLLLVMCWLFDTDS